MKKRLVSIIFVMTLLTGTALAMNVVSVDYPILVNGTVMTFADVVPVNIDGRTLLPLRAVSEAVGVPITWNNETRQVEIQTLDIEALKDACVLLHVRYPSGKGGTQASGVLIDYDELLTCYHAVDEGANTFWADYDDGTQKTLTLQDTAPSEDAAVLTPSDKTVKPVPIGDSDAVKVGDTVYVVSSPNGKMNVVEKTTVTNTNNTNDGIFGFLLSAGTQGGSSGGAVFNTKGELIGMVEAADSTITFMVPINNIRKSLAA